MKSLRIVVAAVGLACALGAAGAAAQVDVADAWVRATVPGQQTAGAYMTLRSTTDARLVGASSPVAKVVEIHEMKVDGGVMSMRAIEKLDLPAGHAVTLSPGGYHVMLMGLVQPLKSGERVPLTLVVEDRAGKRQAVETTVPVRSTAAPK